MANFYLVRHGQDEDNANGILNGHRDAPLTDIGRQQAKELAQRIQNTTIEINLVLTSPLKRTIETAQIISRELSWSEPIVEPLLIERNFGIMTGRRQADIIPICSPDILKTETITYFLSPEGAETFPDLLLRAKKFFEITKQKYPSQGILLVSHGDFGKMLFAAYYNLDWQKVLTSFHFGNSEMLKLSSDTDPKYAKIISIDQHNL